MTMKHMIDNLKLITGAKNNAQLCSKIGVSAPQLSKVLSGRVKNFEIRTLYVISQTCGVSMSQLVQWWELEQPKLLPASLVCP